ncbi:MAG: CoA-transferase [Clostridia bacterium]|jgi:propionate CoA-transferase|nr:CoA-transferase [Clostridia bacterium]
MGKISFITAKEAAAMIPDGARIGTCGFMMTGAAEEILLEIENRFLASDRPRDLTLMWASGVGDGGTVRGLNHLCHEGLLKKTIGGHYGLIKKMFPLITGNKIAAYNFPQGVLCQMFREMAAKKPGVISHVGLGTFADPDFGAGKLNEPATENIVQKIRLGDQDFLFYKSQQIDIALLRGTEADENGNISFRKEALKLEALSVAMAAGNNGGKVFVQVERKVKNGSIDPKNVVIPGILVDYAVLAADEKNHMQTAGTQFSEEFISSSIVVERPARNFLLDERKIIARRAALELDKSDRILNYGIGVPEGVADVLQEEGIIERFTSTVEPGLIGGIALGGLNFGSALAPQAIIDEPYQFDFYDGGGIDATFLGMAQCDAEGNLNVSKFGVRVPGCGGFIDISQNAKKVVLCGAFTAGKLKISVRNGLVRILEEGSERKFVPRVEHLTFNGTYERKKPKRIVIITERAVFELRENGLVLTEIAPGIDLEKDVLAQMGFKPAVSTDLKRMDARIFRDEPMSIKKSFEG